MRKIIAGIKKERPDPVQHDHSAKQNEQQAQIRPSKRLVDNDFQHKRHQQTETGAAHMKHDADVQHALVRFDELIQLFKMRQVFVVHDGIFNQACCWLWFLSGFAL